MGRLSPDSMQGTAKSPLPSVKRCQRQPFLGTEPHNALPTGLLAFDRLLPILPPIPTAGLRHRSSSERSVESCPGIQLTTGRKAGDLLTLTLCTRLESGERQAPDPFGLIVRHPSRLRSSERSSVAGFSYGRTESLLGRSASQDAKKRPGPLGYRLASTLPLGKSRSKNQPSTMVAFAPAPCLQHFGLSTRPLAAVFARGNQRPPSTLAVFFRRFATLPPLPLSPQDYPFRPQKNKGSRNCLQKSPDSLRW